MCVRYTSTRTSWTDISTRWHRPRARDGALFGIPQATQTVAQTIDESYLRNEGGIVGPGEGNGFGTLSVLGSFVHLGAGLLRPAWRAACLPIAPGWHRAPAARRGRRGTPACRASRP